MMRIWLSFIFVVCLAAQSLFGQRLLSGQVFDEHNTPIPLAKVFVKNSAELRTVCDNNGYYEMRLLPGEYYLVFSTTGYAEKEVFIGMADANQMKNINLVPIKFQDIDDIEVNAKKSNPGRDIMLEVVKIRDKINPWNYPHSCEVYIKAAEKIELSQKAEEKADKADQKKNKKKEENTTDSSEGNKGIEDPFAIQRKEDNKFANSMNLVEVQLTRNFEPYNKVKEIRNAYEVRGDVSNLYYVTTVKSNFNFFQNLLHLDDLHQTPVSSPISGPGILSYKYRLMEQYEENGKKINKIKISPRNVATTTLEGFIWVEDSTWLVQKLELTMEKGNLLIYDYFKIYQEFSHPGDSICVLTKQVLDYGVTYNQRSSSLNTTATFSVYDFNVNFEKKYFGNELSITEKEAYDKDTAYWAKSRTTELTEEELKYIQIKDSIFEYQNRKEFQDSVDQVFNKITVWKVLWFGVDHRNRINKTQWTISSIAGMTRPIYIAGPRVAPNFFYFKKWENERLLDSYSEISMGFLNQDIKGNTWWRMRYDPFHFGTAAVVFNHDFDAVQWNNSFSQIYRRNNFIEVTSLELQNENELFNGFYLYNDVEFTERRSIDQYKFFGAIDSVLPNNDPTSFESYQALIWSTKLSYTPAQKFMREPNRKVLLGSKWPTFYAYYERGIPTLFGSDIDFEYARIGVEQTFKLGLLGTTSYHAWAGKFLGTKDLRNADFKYFRPSDPIWFSDPLNTFQGLDTSLPSTKLTYTGHIVHHDNGAILNKIPFMKKTRIGLVVGAGVLYVQELNYQHYELLIGLERIFKMSKRRLRIGVYGALSDGNNIAPRWDWKVSFSFLDNRNMKWNF